MHFCFAVWIACSGYLPVFPLSFPTPLPYSYFPVLKLFCRGPLNPCFAHQSEHWAQRINAFNIGLILFGHMQMRGSALRFSSL